jgi:hypothetical protein
MIKQLVPSSLYPIFLLNCFLVALKEFKQVAMKQFLIPGDAGFPLAGLLPNPADRNEAEYFRTYFKQAREELSYRLCDRLYNADGSKNKWWQVSSFYHHFGFSD